MANFEKAYKENLIAEGGYTLHKVKNDVGGLTYAGITKKYYPNWEGWDIINGHPDGNYPDTLTSLVKDFYKTNYWDRIKGDSILNDNIAETIYDFAINAGLSVSTKLTQLVLNLQPDGIFGKITLGVLNQKSADEFIIPFTLVKIKRYLEICNKNKKQSKFLLGWLNRVMQDLEELN